MELARKLQEEEYNRPQTQPNDQARPKPTDTKDEKDKYLVNKGETFSLSGISIAPPPYTEGRGDDPS